MLCTYVQSYICNFIFVLQISFFYLYSFLGFHIQTISYICLSLSDFTQYDNSRAIHVTTNGIISFFFIHSSVNGHLDCLYVLAIINSAAVNIEVNISFQIMVYAQEWDCWVTYYVNRSVVSNCLQPHGLQPARFPCPWHFPGKNTRVACHFLLQEIFPTQGSNPGLPHCRQILLPLSQRPGITQQLFLVF